MESRSGREEARWKKENAEICGDCSATTSLSLERQLEFPSNYQGDQGRFRGRRRTLSPAVVSQTPLALLNRPHTPLENHYPTNKKPG